MAKFIITQNALNPIADALSGRSFHEGQSAALRNQMMQSRINDSRAEQDKVWRQEEAQQNLKRATVRQQYPTLTDDDLDGLLNYVGGGRNAIPDQPYQMPEVLRANPNALSEIAQALQPYQAVGAYGGDGLDVIRGQGQAGKNQYESTLSDEIVAALKTGNADKANPFIAAKSGRTYEPNILGSGGQVVNKSTGAVTQTPVSVAGIENTKSGTTLNYARTNTEGARQQQMAHKSDLDEREFQFKQANSGGQGGGPKLLSTSDAQMYFSKWDDHAYKMVPDVDKLSAFSRWAMANGYQDQNAALAPYLEYQSRGSGGVGGGAVAGALGSFGGMPTQYDVKKGAFGSKGSVAAADNLQYYDDLSKQQGWAPLTGNKNKAQVMEQIRQMVQTGQMPRDHAAELFDQLRLGD